MNQSRKNRPPEPQLRAFRFSMDKPLIVESKTIGTSMTYKLTTENVSKSGLLLTWNEQMAKAPFCVNTILEMTIDPEGELLDYPVQCLGKVIRRDDQTLKTPKFGVKIVQIEERDGTIWENCLNELEKQALELFASDVHTMAAAPSIPIKRAL